MHLIEYRVRDAFAPERGAVCCPARRIGFLQVDDHSPLAVDPDSLGVGIAGLFDLAVHIYQVGVVQTLEVAHPPGNPGAVLLRVELLTGQGFASQTIPVKKQSHLPGGGCPETEDGLAFRPESAQIVPQIGIGVFKFFGIVKIAHGQYSPYCLGKL